MDDNENVHSYLEILQTRDEGELLGEMDSLVRKLTRLCSERGGVGSITLTIKMQKENKYQDPVFLIEHDVTVKEPKIPRKAGFLFADNRGNLTRYKPEQQPLAGMEAIDPTVIPFKEGDNDAQ